MELNVNPDVKQQYAPGWALTLTISPADDSAYLTWSPSGYAESETFEIRLGRDPLDAGTIARLRSAFEDFPALATIRGARWEYAHDQGCHRWADGPWHGAVADLEARLWGALEARS
ncbi:hypothetical protein ACFC1T_09265 [Kitasatospora sp. NPDC056076]|uniref:hypothetical protein n=1 Tax=Kitasatospora sp. NPDC056076 TaxID=3345703 RepID=UPI0035DDDD25